MIETSARLLALLSLLQMRREWTGSELSSRLEVDVRTVRRDVEKLRSLGYPIESARGVAGGDRLRAGGGGAPPVVGRAPGGGAGGGARPPGRPRRRRGGRRRGRPAHRGLRLGERDRGGVRPGARQARAVAAQPAAPARAHPWGSH